MTYWQTKDDEHGYRWWIFDTPGKPVNVLGQEAMDELAGLIDQANRSTPKAVVITSAKPGQFIAGADITEISGIDTTEVADQKASAGHRIFLALHELHCPTVAVVNGACMGGGSELALACRYRVMTDHPKAAMALPEVRLGILPGWGGTVRLPRLVGYANAVDMITSGRSARARRARAIGLIDGMVNDAFREEGVAGLLADPPAPKPLPLSERLPVVATLKRALVTMVAGKQIQAVTGGRMPAPKEALLQLSASWGMTPSAAARREVRTFCHLATTPASKHLVGLFLQTEAAKRSARGDHGVRRVAVIGAGVMGGGIAWLLASRGLDVRMKDLSCDALAHARRTIDELARKATRAKALSAAQAGRAVDRIAMATDDTGLDGCDLAIEAVVEKLSVKQQVVAELERLLPAHATIATNTSSLTLADIGAQMHAPARLVGMHFFNPVHKMPLVEVVAQSVSDPAHVERVAALAAACGKVPVTVGDCAGFLVNRILLPCLNEAGWLLQEGCHPQHVDRVLKRFGLPMGAFRLADEVGLDVGLHVARNLEAAYGARARVAPALVLAHEELGLLGRKGGVGFYRYGTGKEQVNEVLANRFQPRGAVPDADAIRDRCLLAMVLEAARCLEEGIVATPELCDLALVTGTGFPPERGGLLAWACERGVDWIRERSQHFADQGMERFAPPAALERLGEATDSHRATNTDDTGTFRKERQTT